MSNEDLKAQADRTAPQIKIAAGLWGLGMMIIAATTITWIVVSIWANDFYSSSKAVRDAAGAGSSVLSDLQNFQATKAWVMPLELAGLGTFLVGFGFAFANILQNIRLRANTMAAVLPALKERKTRA